MEWTELSKLGRLLNIVVNIVIRGLLGTDCDPRLLLLLLLVGVGGRYYEVDVAVEGGGVIGRNGLLLETLDLTLSNQGFGLSIGLLVAAVAVVVASVVVVIVDMMF